MQESTLSASLLVAMPQLRDPNFRRTVVMLVHHDEDGAFGVVLNRETEISALGLCASLDVEWRGQPETSIGWGGPVQPQTGWLLFDPPPGYAHDEVQRLGDGICFAGSLDVLRQVAVEPPHALRLLVGYAGWGPGQLEAELAEGAWIVAPMSREVVFDVHPTVMWDHTLRGLGVEPATLIATRGVH